MKNIRFKTGLIAVGIITGLVVILSFTITRINNANEVASIRSFDAYMIDDVAFINWVTFSEGSGKFILEKSLDGKNFTTVKEFKQNGVGSKYTFVDKNPNFGLSYYRINGEVSSNGEHITPLINHDGPLNLNVRINDDAILISTSYSKDRNYLITLSDDAGRHYFIQSCALSIHKNVLINRSELDPKTKNYTLRVHGESWSIDKKIAI